MCVYLLYAPVLYHAGMNGWTFQLEWKNWNKTKRKEIICSMYWFNIGHYALHLYSMLYVLSGPEAEQIMLACVFSRTYSILYVEPFRPTNLFDIRHCIAGYTLYYSPPLCSPPFPLHVYIIFIHLIFSLPSVCCIDSYNQKEKISFIFPALPFILLIHGLVLIIHIITIKPKLTLNIRIR